MTRDEILNMQAGRNTDALIAEMVMRYLNVGRRTLGNAGTMLFYEKDGDEFRLVPKFSTDIAAAWEVIERIREIDEYWCPYIHWDDDDGEGNPMWVVSFNYFGEDESQFKVAEAQDKSAPVAICRAALLAVMESK
jgi:hypothetical protein